MARPHAAVPLSGKKFLGINILEGLFVWDFVNLYGVTFVAGMLIIMPAIIQPAFLKEVIGIPPNLSGSINSFLQNMSQIATLLFIGYFGALSDKYGRVVLAFIGFIITGFSYILFGYIKPIAEVIGISPIIATYISRFLIAAGFVMTWPMFSTLAADYTLYRDRGKAMAYNGLSIGCGGIIVFGVLSQVPKHYGLMTLFYISFVLAIIGALWVKSTLRDRMPETKASKSNIKVIYQIVSKNMALKVSYVGVLVARSDQMILGTLVMVWAVHTARAHGYTHLQATGIGGFALSVQMAVSVLLTPVFGYLIDRVGRMPVIIFSFFMGVAGYFLLGYIGHPFSKWIWLAVSLVGTGQGIVNIASNALAANVSPKPLLGSIMGGKNSMAPIGSIIFLQLGGFFFDKFGPASAFYMKGIVNLITLLWIVAVSKKVVEEEIPYKP